MATLDLKLYKEEELVINESNVEYQREDNTILFELEGMQHRIDMQNKILERYNNEFHFTLDFEKNHCTYELKSHQATFDIIVDDAFYEHLLDHLELSYAIETDDQKTKIEIDLKKE